jgi:hypothetical protein
METLKSEADYETLVETTDAALDSGDADESHLLASLADYSGIGGGLIWFMTFQASRYEPRHSWLRAAFRVIYKSIKPTSPGFNRGFL